MNQENQVKQYFAETEFCLRKYFSENFSPIIVKQSEELRRKQSREVEDHLQRNRFALMGGAGAASSIAVQSQMALLQQTGKWNSKTTEWLLESCRKEFTDNGQVRKDLQTMAACYRSLFIRQIGEKKYNEISRSLPMKDLAYQYITSRFDEMFVDKLARIGISRSSLEYILKTGFSESLAGWIGSSMTRTTELDDKIKARSEQIYDPSTAEKFAAKGVRIATDVATTGGVGSWAAAGRTIVVETAVELLSSSTDDPQEFSRQMGKVVFDDDKAFLDIQKKATRVSPKTSVIVDRVNNALARKMKLPTYVQLYSPYEQKTFSSQFTKASQGSGSAMLKNVRSVFSQFGISVDRKSSVPSWMKSKSKQECLQYSAYFAGAACEMKAKNKQEITCQGRKYTYREVCQRAYDYARVASSYERTRDVHPSGLHSAAPYVASSVQTTPSVNNMSQNYQQTVGTVQQTTGNISLQSPVNQPESRIGGWSGLMNQMGYSAFGDVWKNIGYVIATLPDMIAGMFTGKTRNLKFRDNVLPIAAILLGLFTKRNPLLKLMLLGFGGLTLLKKAGSEALDDAGAGGVGHKTYKTYPDERIDPRITGVAMKGNTMLCNIDDKPLVLTISDTAVDAYCKGKVPLNTLANAVLRKYDEQQNSLSTSYEDDVSLQSQRQRNLTLK